MQTQLRGPVPFAVPLLSIVLPPLAIFLAIVPSRTFVASHSYDLKQLLFKQFHCLGRPVERTAARAAPARREQFVW